MSFWSNKKVLVAGGTGMTGRPLTRRLIEQGAKVKVASLDDRSLAHPEVMDFLQIDLTNYDNCLFACKGMDYVFNLMCIKGSPKAMKEHPAIFWDKLTLMGMFLPRAAFARGSGYLFTSSVGVYQPAEVLQENDVWKTQPSKNDWFAGHAKRMGELQVEAYRQQHNWLNTAIVRPSNVYGPHDNFSPDSALFIAAKIRQFADKENPIVVWGDGSQIRDFIHAEDAASGLMLAAEKSAGPVNLCSGRSTTVREVIEILAKNVNYKPEIIFDTSKPAGDARRLLDVTRLKALGFEPQISLENGIRDTLNWYLEHHQDSSKRYNIFK